MYVEIAAMNIQFERIQDLLVDLTRKDGGPWLFGSRDNAVIEMTPAARRLLFDARGPEGFRLRVARRDVQAGGGCGLLLLFLEPELLGGEAESPRA
jgi:hypothetical protein